MLRSRLVAPAVALALAVASPPGWAAPADHCSPGDRPETGVQGQVPLADQLSGRSQQGYWCNLRPVGSNDIGGQGGDTQMTWYGDCAYRSTPGGDGDEVAVIDVRDPRRPTVVHTITETDWAGRGGVLGIHEGLHVSDRRGLLVVPLGTGIWVYDVSRDCRRPRLLGSLDFGLPDDVVKQQPGFDDGIHSGKLSPDGTLYYATDLGNGAVSMTGPCLTVLDLRNPAKPRLVTRWGLDFPCHDLSLSPDGKRAYVGWYAADVGHPAAVVGAFAPVPASHPVSGLKVLDVSALQAHSSEPVIVELSSMTGGRQHTETFTEIAGRKYVIAAEEGSCPGGNGRIVDVTDERNPVQVAEVPLGVNSLENCAAYRADTGSELLLYMSHYVSVDDPRNASLAFFTWYSSGLRVFDIRDPRNPREVAYLNPAVGEGSSASHDSSTTYTRYLPRTGQVWFGSSVGGFHVAELAPHLRPRVPGGRRTWSVPPVTGTVEARTPSFDVARLLASKGVKWWCTAGVVPEHHL